MLQEAYEFWVCMQVTTRRKLFPSVPGRETSAHPTRLLVSHSGIDMESHLALVTCRWGQHAGVGNLAGRPQISLASKLNACAQKLHSCAPSHILCELQSPQQQSRYVRLAATCLGPQCECEQHISCILDKSYPNAVFEYSTIDENNISDCIELWSTTRECAVLYARKHGAAFLYLKVGHHALVSALLCHDMAELSKSFNGSICLQSRCSKFVFRSTSKAH